MNQDTQSILVNIIVGITAASVVFFLIKKHMLSNKKKGKGCGDSCGCAKPKKNRITLKTPPTQN